MLVLRWIVALLAAIVVTAGLGSIIQTQFNLARIATLNEPIDLGTRLEVTMFDLVSFAPLYAVIVALALLIAMLVATFLARFLPRGHALLFALAGFVAVACALVIMNLMMPVTIIAAVRTTTGLVAMSLAGAVGGWVYCWIGKK